MPKPPILHALAGLMLAGSLSVAASANAEGGPRFLSGIAALPLTPGLSELLDEGVVFENPLGRIVRATATGRVAEAIVRRFYSTALPALGWEPSGTNRFVREGEILRLHMSAEGGRVTVRFALGPHHDSAK